MKRDETEQGVPELRATDLQYILHETNLTRGLQIHCESDARWMPTSQFFAE